jgi:hypothetical protein
MAISDHKYTTKKEETNIGPEILQTKQILLIISIRPRKSTLHNFFSPTNFFTRIAPPHTFTTGM